MEQAVELMMGISFLVLGLSYMLRTDDWFVVMDHLKKKDRRASLAVGVPLLFLGSFITAFHWVWEGWPMLVTIIGLILMAKGLVYLLFPYWLPAKLAFFERYHLERMFRIAGLVVVIMAAAILYGWWKQI